MLKITLDVPPSQPAGRSVLIIVAVVLTAGVVVLALRRVRRSQ